MDILECCVVLGVQPEDSTLQIKKVFRQKAKKLHPDRNPKGAKEFLRLRGAYETLIYYRNKGFFSDYIRQAKKEQEKKQNTFDYRKWLKDRADDESMAKLVFYELMTGHDSEAVKLYKDLNTQRPNFRLSSWFTKEDFMDWGYILSEELIFRGEYYDAAVLLSCLIKMERQHPYFKHFFPEVMSLAKDLFLKKIKKTLCSELAIDCYEMALDLDFNIKCKYDIMLLMAQEYKKIGDLATALDIYKAASILVDN